MTLKFWGVRGSIACPGPGTARYGGNTSCIEVRCGGRIVIFDGGTGLRPFGDALVGSGRPLDSDLFLTHCHLDHVSGLPFFAPLFAPGNRLRIWAGNLPPGARLKRVLNTMMSPPLFPVDVESFKAAIDYRQFKPGDTLKPCDGIVLRTAALNHPGGAVGYRLDHAGKALAYITDTELLPGPIDPGVLALARGADLVIVDSTYTEAEIAAHRGWGHSTWKDAIRLADAAGAGTLCLFHHDPGHDDDFMDKVGREAAAARPDTMLAREGLTIGL